MIEAALAVNVISSLAALVLALRKQRPMHIHFTNKIERDLITAQLYVLKRDAAKRQKRDKHGRFTRAKQ
jgi:hypothetical protein